MRNLPDALAPLAAFNQWMVYKLVPSRKRPGKTDKFPVSVQTGDIVDAHNPENWTDAQTALAIATAWGDSYGLAFVFTENDPFFFIDIDGAYDVTSQRWSPVATQICEALKGCAVEVSQSNTGLHIFGMYSGAEPLHSCKNIPLNLECYTSGRFVALTGKSMVGSAATDADEALAGIIAGYFPLTSEAPERVEWTTHAHVDSTPIEEDSDLIANAIKSKSMAGTFGGAATFADLWNANEEALSQFYPDDRGDQGRGFDHSSADAALAQHLAFWTGGNCERVERLMRASALVRDKWDYHKNYLTVTIKGAVARCKNFYNKARDTVVIDRDAVVESGPVIREGFQYMPADQQITYFKGCAYVCDQHRIATPSGTMMKSEQFNAMYGGYNFALDYSGDKTTKKAFEAFTESQTVNFPKVDTTCFRPALESGKIVKEDGRLMVNTYVPVDVFMTEGDVSPFMIHVKKLLPDERDRTILLSYMAACVQHKGVKFQWAPLVQGVEGNGKTLFSRCVAYAVGERYSHFPPAEQLAEKFNSWLFDKLFIGVEDIYVPNERREVLEILKPMITNNRLAKRAMQTDQVMGDVCANFLFNSNHKNAVTKTQNDRRYSVFYTAQQDAIDLIRDGMDGEYFPNLYDWLKGSGKYFGQMPGYAIVANWLKTYEIPAEFNPAGNCQRAPITTSTQEAVQQSVGPVEQEIAEAIDEGRPGFAGGWVSSMALDKLIDDMRKGGQIPRNKRRDLMKTLGYDYHPGLSNGRVNNAISIDGGKPRLYIKIGHIHSNLTGPAEIARYYSAAQGDATARLAIGTVDGTVNTQ